MTQLDLMIKRVGMWLTYVGFVLILMLMLHVSADVIGKFLFNAPIPDTLEIVSAYYMVGILFLPLAYVTFGEGHIVVELFTRGVSQRRLLFMESIIGVLSLIYALLLTWMTLDEAITQTAQREVWEGAGYLLLVWPSRWVLPIGCGLMALYMALRIVQDFQAARQTDPAAKQTG